MHRQPLLNMLSLYARLYPAEREVAERISALVREHSDCFLRTCRPGHITGSAWVLSKNSRRCLLVYHAKLNRWLQPGGHADGQSNVAEVALREALEESGLTQLRLPSTPFGQFPLDLDVHLIPARHAPDGTLLEDAHEHHDVRFLLLASGDEAPVVSEESHDVRWCTHEEVLTLTDEESVLRMMRKAGPFPEGQPPTGAIKWPGA